MMVVMKNSPVQLVPTHREHTPARRVAASELFSRVRRTAAPTSPAQGGPGRGCAGRLLAATGDAGGGTSAAQLEPIVVPRGLYVVTFLTLIAEYAHVRSSGIDIRYCMSGSIRIRYYYPVLMYGMNVQ